MGTRKPTVSVEFVVIEAKLSDQLRMLGTAAFQTRAYIQNDQTLMPVSEIGEAILNVEIVQVTTRHLIAFLGANGGGERIFSLPARNFFRILHVSKIDHAH